jgi:Domain of unknown function (DUF4349)
MKWVFPLLPLQAKSRVFLLIAIALSRTSCQIPKKSIGWPLFSKKIGHLCGNQSSFAPMGKQAKNNMKKIVILMSIALFWGCSSEYKQSAEVAADMASAPMMEQAAEYEEMAMAKKAEAPQVAEQQGNASEQIIERKIIRTGNIRFETDDLAESKKLLMARVNQLGGYVSNEAKYEHTTYAEQTMTVRVPYQKFDTLLLFVTEHAAKITNQDINAQDVTEEFIDIQARLKTKKDLEQRYTELLKMAKNVEEILSIERQLGEVRAEIESMQGRLQYLSSQVNFSTLTISFFVSTPTIASFGGEFGEGFVNGWNNLVYFFIGLINIWPFIIIAIIAFFAFRKWRKNRIKAQKA